ncbi:MAG TPA: MFS transporter [Eubacteriaceae bacterium]|nr:MFS transporter [Eubacteriaceae bacterium]
MNQKMEMKNDKANSKKRWLYVLLGIIIMMCLGTVYSYSIFRLPIEEVFQVGTAQSGMPYMAALAFYAVFMFLAGKHIDRFDPRIIMAAGGLIVGLGWMLSAYAPNIYVLTVTYGLISGAGVGIVYGVPMTVVAKWFPEKRGLTVGMVLIGFGMSPLITAPLARILVEQFGVMSTFQLLGMAFGMIIPLLSLPFRYPERTEKVDMKNTERGKEYSRQHNTRDMIRSKSFKGLYINFIIGTMIGLMLIGLTSKIAMEWIGLSSSQAALWMALFAVFNGMGRPIFGWFTDKRSPKEAIYLSYALIISAAVLILFAKEGSLLIYVVSFSVFWFNLGGWLAIAPTSTMKLYGGKHYSQNYGVVFTAYGIGAIVGVLSSGMMLDAFQNHQYVIYYVIALCLIGVMTTANFIKKGAGKEHPVPGRQIM